MLKDSKFWLSIIPTILALIPQVQAMLPQEGLAYTLVACLALVGNYVYQRMSLETEQVKEVVSRNLVRARQLESDTLTRALAARAAGSAIQVHVGGLDQEIG